MDWILYNEQNYIKCKINIFDDGNQFYQKYINEWYIIGTNNKGKVRLKNINENIVINSISTWKTTMY